jgi:tetratricopeptide (TPR) repeat protein
MAMHEEWTDKLSEYLDDELSPREREAVESHLRGCAECAAVLHDLTRVVERAQSLDRRPPRADLWEGIAARIETRGAAPRRVSFTLPQLAAAAVLLIAVSAGLAWQIAGRSAEASRSRGLAATPTSERDPSTSSGSSRASSRDEALTDREPSAERSNIDIAHISFADAQYDAAVSDLEKALQNGRGRLDKTTIEVVEHNLQIIDQAIEQARQALEMDPANDYLSGHLVDARRRKLDLLRRAAALTTESD